MELIRILKAVKDGVSRKKLPVSTNVTQEEQFIERQVFLEEAALYGEEVFLEIISDFSEEYRSVMQRMKIHINNSDFKSAEREAHKFAGTLSTFHCSRLVDAVRDLEQKAAEKDFDGLTIAYPVLKDSINTFMSELDDVRKTLIQRSKYTSPASVKEFYKKVKENEKLLQQLKELTKKSGPDLSAKILQFARKQGYLFSEEDLKNHSLKITREIAPRGELSDEQLDAAAGGNAEHDIIASAIIYGLDK